MIFGIFVHRIPAPPTADIRMDRNSYLRKTAIPSIGLALVVLGIFFGVFGLLRNKSIYFKVGGQYLINCEWNEEGGYKDLGNRSYAARSRENLLNWDAANYHRIKDAGYHTGAGHDNMIVPFFPLFPVIWKASFLPIQAIGFLNYAMFITGLLLLGAVLLKNTPQTQSILLLGACMVLPASAVFHMPYSEAASFLAMSAAVWAWFRKRALLFYLFLFLFSLSRPVSGVLGMSFLCAAIYQSITSKTSWKMWMQVGLVILVLITGPLLYFTYHYTYYGDFWIFFKMQREVWGTYARIPEKITDWSFESLSMNLFGFFCLVLPVTAVTAIQFPKALRERKKYYHKGFFDGNSHTQTQFLKSLTLAFCIGLTLFTIIYQGGNLHSYSRYLLAGPAGIILILAFGREFHKARSWQRGLLILIPATLAVFLWDQIPYHWRWDIRDAPFFLMLALMLLLAFYDELPKVVFWPVTVITGLLCIVFQTHMYNLFLMDCWFFL